MTKKLTKDEKLKVLFDDSVEEGIVPKLSEADYNEEFKHFTQLKSKKLPYIYDIDHFCKLIHSSSKQVNFFCLTKRKLMPLSESLKKMEILGK